ncbi:MAG: hypothetical protein WC120_01040 [Parcubacteria group bacterium]
MNKIDNKKIPTVLGTIIIIIIAITVGSLVWKYEKIKSQDEAGMQNSVVEFAKPTEEKQEQQNQSQQQEKPDSSENAIVQQISFCGINYQSNKFEIEGIDVIQKISKLLIAKDLCKNYKINTKNGDTLKVEPNINKDGSTYFYIFFDGYKIDKDYNIYIINGFTGNPDLLGKLK